MSLLSSLGGPKPKWGCFEQRGGGTGQVLNELRNRFARILSFVLRAREPNPLIFGLGSGTPIAPCNRLCTMGFTPT